MKYLAGNRMHILRYLTLPRRVIEWPNRESAEWTLNDCFPSLPKLRASTEHRTH